MEGATLPRQKAAETCHCSRHANVSFQPTPYSMHEEPAAPAHALDPAELSDPPTRFLGYRNHWRCCTRNMRMSNNVVMGGNEQLKGTSSNAVGKSVESQAQLRDAARESSTFVGRGEMLGVYELVPIAAFNDPNWDIAPWRGKMLVAARTTGDARVVAAAFEGNFMKVPSIPGESIAAMGASAFRNEKLYTVIEIDRDRRDLDRGVMEISDTGLIASEALRADFDARPHDGRSPSAGSLSRWDNEGGANP
ncbi:hypothetical protein G6L73_28290 [Agrobacterium rhizogenes]|nr:hypothetical protein [Rhizobium rhizogenes]NTH35397.1 hypothetical protein [Rhizobium rhizogenes]